MEKGKNKANVLLTLSEELQWKGELERRWQGIHRPPADAVRPPRTSSIDAQIVREKALLRRLIEVSTGIVQQAFEGRTTTAELLDEAESKIFQVCRKPLDEGFTRIKELLWPTMERIEALHQGGGRPSRRARSGFCGNLDEML